MKKLTLRVVKKRANIFGAGFRKKIFPKFRVLGGRPLLPLKINFIVEGRVIGQMKGNFMPRKKVNWSKVVRPRFQGQTEQNVFPRCSSAICYLINKARMCVCRLSVCLSPLISKTANIRQKKILPPLFEYF